MVVSAGRRSGTAGWRNGFVESVVACNLRNSGSNAMEQSQSWAGAQSKERVELLGAVHGVRTRWKVRRALLEMALALAGSLAVLTILAYTLNALDYADRAVMIGQAIAVVTVLAMLWWLVIRPILP